MEIQEPSLMMQDSEMQNIWRWKWRRRRRRRRRGKVLAGSRWRSAEKNTSLSEIEPLGIMIILLDIFRFFLRFRLKRQMEKIHLCRSLISMRTVKLLFLSRRCRRSSRFFELLTFGIRKVRSFQTQFHLQIASDFSYLWRRLLIRADMSGEEERKVKAKQLKMICIYIYFLHSIHEAAFFVVPKRFRFVRKKKR